MTTGQFTTPAQPGTGENTPPLGENTQPLGEDTQPLAKQAQETAQELGGQAQEKVQEMTGQAKGKLREQLDQRSSQVAEQINHQASDLRAVSEALRQQGNDGPARAAEKLAEYVQKVGSYLGEKDSGSLLSDAEDLGRRQPLAAGAGALALGFAASRFLKASSRKRYSSVRPQTAPPRYPATGTTQAPAPPVSPAPPAVPSAPPGSTLTDPVVSPFVTSGVSDAADRSA